MKKTIAIIFAAILAAIAARAASSEHSTTNGYVATTNEAAGAAWSPSHVFFVFTGPKTGTVAVLRTAKGITVPLARYSFTNEDSALWLPPAAFPIRPGDVLALTSSVPTFSAQIEKAE